MEGWWRRACSWWKRRSTTRNPPSARSLWRIAAAAMVVFGIVTVWAGSKGFDYSNPAWLWWWFSTAAQGSSSNVVEGRMSSSPPKNLTVSHEVRYHDDDGDKHSFKNINNSVSVSPPPVAVEVIQQSEKPVTQKEEILNNTKTDSSHVNFPLKESHAPSLIPRIRRSFSNLYQLELKLQQARIAIRGAAKGNQSYDHDTDYVPTGPMYWKAKAFHRSYLEMEKQFKIYVYEEGEPPIFHGGPCKGIYSTEGNFIYHMEDSKFRTRDLDKAHVYFLPFSVVEIVHFICDRKLIRNKWDPMKRTVKDYVNLIAGRYPYWNRSTGVDHFMLSCHDWGPELSKSVPELFKNSIRALCNANKSEGFNPSKDVSIPEINLPSHTLAGILGGPSPSRRPILAFFAGGVHGPIRPALMEHWENKDQDIRVQRYLPKGVSYYGMMKKSKYCLCPSGFEVASPRMVEALYTGCVPVIIKDHYVSPFSDVLNWKAFSVEVAVNDIPNLKKILSEISSRQYIRLHRRGKQIRRHFEVNWPPKRYDVFHMTLHSIWLRRLNIRLPRVEYM